MILSLFVGLSGIGLAYLVYLKKLISADAIANRFKLLYKLSYNKFYFDEIYGVILLNPVMKIASLMWKFDAGIIDGLVNGVAWATILWSDLKMLFDTWVIDGAVNGAGWVVRETGNLLRFIQNGQAQFYALTIATLVVLIGIFKLEFVRIDLDWPIITTIFVVGVPLIFIVTRLAWNNQDDSSDPAQDKKA